MNNVDLKLNAARAAIHLIPPEGVVGIGTGSTVAKLITLMSETPEKYDKILFVPTSRDTEMKLKSAGFRVSNDTNEAILLDIDGADEVDPDGNMIKGGGGALTREKIVASNSAVVCIIADGSKRVNKLGKFTVPVEILPYLYLKTIQKIESMGSTVKLRPEGRNTSDNGNLLCDADFGLLENPRETESKLKMIPGVVEVGIFCKMAHRSYFASKNGIEEVTYR